MKILFNHAKDRLLGGGLAVGLTVRLIRTPEIALIAKTAGYEFLLIDREHGAASMEQVAQISIAALSAGITPIVRVPSQEPFQTSLALDCGAMGVVVPHIHTADQARAVVESCKFPPLGKRSIPGALPQFSYSIVQSTDAALRLNEQTILAVMLESSQAIENVEEISAVAGVDVLWIGPNDLCADMGIMGGYDDERLVEAYRRVLSTAAAHGKHVAMGGIYDEALVAKFVSMGVRMLLGGADLAFVSRAASERRSFLAKLEPVSDRQER